MKPILAFMICFGASGLGTGANALADETVKIGDAFTADGRVLDEAEILRAVTGANYLLLGETHTSAATHRWQAQLLDHFSKAAKIDALVFEMIPADLQPEVDRYVDGEPQNAKGLGEAVGWEERGWPDWGMYRPIADIALLRNIPIIGGDLPRDTIRSVGQQGKDALSPEQAVAFGLDSDLAQTASQTLTTILRESHCGLLPDEALAPMATVQRARDGALANAMIEAAGDGKRVALIAGNGHVRRDFAVPAILEMRDPDAETIVVGLLETAAEPQPFAAYDLKGADGKPLYDIVVFTGPHDDTDHCAALREQFGKTTK